MDPPIQSFRFTVITLCLFQLICTHIQVAHRQQHIRKAKVVLNAPVNLFRITVMLFCLL